jgi:hypothetical protein
MAHIVTLGPPPAAESAAFRRVRLGSRVLVVLFTVILAGLVLLALAEVGVVLFYQGDLITLGPTGGWIGTNPPPGYQSFVSMSLVQRLAYAVTAVVRLAPAILIFHHLRALFALYGRGVVFARENAAHILWIGVWLVAHAADPFLCHLALGAAGLEVDHRWAHFGSLQELGLGALVFVVAQVMQVGREIEEEREQFV